MRFNPAQNWPVLPVAGPWRKAVLAAAAVIMTLPRLAHTTPDSAYYIALTCYFKGQAGRDELVAPFAFRWVVPWLASWLPDTSPAMALALCSVIAFAGTALCLDRLLRTLNAPRAGANTGLLAFLLSFPALNYGGAVLTDSAGMLVLAAAVCALVERRFLLLGLVLGAGAGVRETTLLMLPGLVLYLALERDKKGLLAAGPIVLATLMATGMPRWCLFELPAYGWQASWSRFTENLARPISWTTVSLTLVPILLVALPGLLRWREQASIVRHFVLALGLPGLALLSFSTTSAFMSGRFAWPLYLVLVPLVAFNRRVPQSASG